VVSTWMGDQLIKHFTWKGVTFVVVWLTLETIPYHYKSQHVYTIRVRRSYPWPIIRRTVCYIPKQTPRHYYPVRSTVKFAQEFENFLLFLCRGILLWSPYSKYVKKKPLHKHKWQAGLGQIWGCIEKFPDWPPGARTANDTALCH